jgi:hypothetical protein
LSKPDRPEIDVGEERRARLASAEAVPVGREPRPPADAARPSPAAEHRRAEPATGDASDPVSGRGEASRSEAVDPNGGGLGDRGGREPPGGQGIDPAALETWVGSGEATDLFSRVFGGFLPVEGVARGFFARLSDRLEGFPDRLAGRAGRNDRRGEAQLVHLHRAGTGTLPTENVEPLEEAGAHSAALDEPRRLDGATRERMERALGGDFTRVRIHTGAGAAEAARRYAADALTVEDHIFFAPGRFNPNDSEGQRLLAHELAHVLQKGRKNLDVRTAESEARAAERSFGQTPPMETLDLSRPKPDFKLPDGDGSDVATGVHAAKRSRSRGSDVGAKDELPDGEELLERVSERVYELLLAELEESFESR